MDKNDLLKSPLVLIIATGILILILYFIMSPYQNCIRGVSPEFAERYTHNSAAILCVKDTSW